MTNPEVLCYFCDKPITKPIGRQSDSHIVHHIDGNHENDIPENRADAHYGCHVSYHNGKPILEQSEARQKQIEEWSRLGREAAKKVNSLPISQHSEASQRQFEECHRLGIEAAKEVNRERMLGNDYSKGLKRSEETKRKMRESAIKRWERQRERVLETPKDENGKFLPKESCL